MLLIMMHILTAYLAVVFACTSLSAFIIAKQICKPILPVLYLMTAQAQNAGSDISLHWNCCFSIVFT